MTEKERKAALLLHLRKAGRAGISTESLRRYMPDASRQTIQSLLGCMRRAGLVAWANVGGTNLWVLVRHIEALREAAAEKAADNQRKKMRRYLDKRAKSDRKPIPPDEVETPPFVHRLIPAAGAPIPETNAPRWVFEAAQYA